MLPKTKINRSNYTQERLIDRHEDMDLTEESGAAYSADGIVFLLF